MDAYTWTALYVDGTYLPEHEATQGFASVDQEHVKSIELHSSDDFSMHSVSIPQGAQPVFFRRRRIAINVMEESSEPQATVHCIGWKRSEEDAVYLFVFADASTLLSSDLQAG